MGDRSNGSGQSFTPEEIENLTKLKVKGEEVTKLENEFEVINKAYNLLVNLYKSTNMDRDEFKLKFSGIANDYKMSKLRMEVAQDEWASIGNKQH